MIDPQNYPFARLTLFGFTQKRLTTHFAKGAETMQTDKKQAQLQKQSILIEGQSVNVLGANDKCLLLLESLCILSSLHELQLTTCDSDRL